MEENNYFTEPLLDKLKNYAEVRLKLAKYQAIDKGTVIASFIMVDLVIAAALVIVVLVAGITLAVCLADVLGSYWRGFSIVAVVYVVIALFVKTFKKVIGQKLRNWLIRKLT